MPPRPERPISVLEPIETASKVRILNGFCILCERQAKLLEELRSKVEFQANYYLNQGYSAHDAMRIGLDRAMDVVLARAAAAIAEETK